MNTTQITTARHVLRKSGQLRWVALLIVLFAPRITTAQVTRRRTRPQPEEVVTPQEREAREAHARGVHMLRIVPPNSTGAIAELLRALRLREGGPLEYLEYVHIARGHQNLGRYAEAIEWYLRYLRAAPGSAAVRTANEPSGAEVKDAIRSMRTTLCWLHIETNVPSAEVWDGERLVGHAPGITLVETGRRSIELRASDHLPARQDVTVSSGEHRSLRFVLQHRGLTGLRPRYVLVAGGTAVASLIAGAVFGSVALALDAQVNEERGVRATQGDFGRAMDFALVADVLYGTGAVLLVTAGILTLSTDFSSLLGRRRGVAALVAPMMGGNGNSGLQLIGSF